MSDEQTGESSGENWLHGRLAWKGKDDDVRMFTTAGRLFSRKQIERR